MVMSRYCGYLCIYGKFQCAKIYRLRVICKNVQSIQSKVIVINVKGQNASLLKFHLSSCIYILYYVKI